MFKRHLHANFFFLIVFSFPIYRVLGKLPAQPVPSHHRECEDMIEYASEAIYYAISISYKRLHPSTAEPPTVRGESAVNLNTNKSQMAINIPNT